MNDNETWDKWTVCSAIEHLKPHTTRLLSKMGNVKRLSIRRMGLMILEELAKTSLFFVQSSLRHELEHSSSIQTWSSMTSYSMHTVIITYIIIHNRCLNVLWVYLDVCMLMSSQDSFHLRRTIVSLQFSLFHVEWRYVGLSLVSQDEWWLYGK